MWSNENKWIFCSPSNYVSIYCVVCIHIKPIFFINFIYHQLCKYLRILSDCCNYSYYKRLFHMVWNSSFFRPSSKFVKVLTRHLTEYMPVYTDIVQGMLLDCWPRHCQSQTPERFTIYHIHISCNDYNIKGFQHL